VHAGPGSWVLLPTGVPFSARFAPGCRRHHTLFIRFTLYTRESIDWFLLYRLPVLIAAEGPKAWTATAREILRQMEHGLDSIRRMKANALLHGLLAEIVALRYGDIRPAPSERARKVDQAYRLIRWMEHHLAESFTLADLAGQLHASTDYVNDLFRTVTGQPPMQYANWLRVRRAKSLLADRTLSVQDVSGMVGIADPHYFSRLFKKIEGVSPSQYIRHLHRL
jgi:AraC-like DNA-binding protein